MSWWQHIPEYVNPIAFTVGFFSVHWYALFWLLGFTVAVAWVKHDKMRFGLHLAHEDILDLFLLLFLGAFIGGHLGYALLYRPDIFLNHPALFFFPYDQATGSFVGIAGMSFHGGLIGVSMMLFFYTRRKRIDFWLLSDVVALAAPLALFFGRLGNFFAIELYGRVTASAWGMYFPGTPDSQILRHPSTLYEAFGEGLILFLLLLFVRRFLLIRGQLAAGFLVGYGVIRFCIEYLREPDQGLMPIFGIWTRGQFYSLFLVVSGTLLFLWLRERNRGTIKK